MNPNTVPNYRSAAGLPDVSEGRFVIEGVVKKAEGITVTTARVIKPGQQGGLREVVIRNSQGAVKVERVSGVNPPF